MRKHFVLDTNVLLHDASSLMAFGDNVVVIPITVIEELDKFKGHNDELGRNAREVVRTLDRLRQRGSLGRGVPLNDSGGELIVDTATVSGALSSTRPVAASTAGMLPWRKKCT